ncbi:hypothetical protein [Zoogloea sp.]|uniref:hypothetical protein n=1 Tax=Zoogloea sp. TaxID=49181 RepID=UPI001415FB00|nr:MAG: hypothetical protein F9K15_07770 [Zoogloea sp.]
MKIRSLRRQQGTVLAVVLVVLVVMMLGSISMFSSIDTSALLTGNIGFKRDSLNTSGAGLNRAFKMMKDANFAKYQDSVVGCPPPAATGTKCTDAAQWKALNFYPRLLEADASGIPVAIKDLTAFGAISNSANIISKNGNTVYFLIERMCNSYGLAGLSNCVLSSYTPKGGEYFTEKPGSVASPVYRVTVRIDGVRNTRTYAQWNVTFRQD